MQLPVPPSGVPLAGIHYELTKGEPVTCHDSFKRHVADDFIYVRFVQKINNLRGHSPRVACVTPHALMLCTIDGNITRFVPMSCITELLIAPLSSKAGSGSRVYIKTVQGIPDLLLDLEPDPRNLGTGPSELTSVIARVKALRGEWNEDSVREVPDPQRLKQQADLKKTGGYRLPETKQDAIEMERGLLGQSQGGSGVPPPLPPPPDADEKELRPPGSPEVSVRVASVSDEIPPPPPPLSAGPRLIASPLSPASPELTFVETSFTPHPVFADIADPVPPPSIYSPASVPVPMQPQSQSLAHPHPPPSSYMSYEEPAWIPQMPWYEMPDQLLKIPGSATGVPGGQFTFPADRDFWDNFMTEHQLFRGGSDPPHYVITTSHSDENLTVNQGFLQMFLQGWEAANPNTVVLSTHGLEQTFKASDEFVEFFELQRNKNNRETEMVVQHNNGHPIRIGKQEWRQICMAWEEAKRVTAGDKQRLFDAKCKEIQRRKEMKKTPLPGAGSSVVTCIQTLPIMCIHCGQCATGDLPTMDVSSPVNPISVIASPISITAGQVVTTPAAPAPTPTPAPPISPTNTASSRGMFWTAFMQEWEKARSPSPSHPHSRRTSPPRYNPAYGTPVAL